MRRRLWGVPQCYIRVHLGGRFDRREGEANAMTVGRTMDYLVDRGALDIKKGAERERMTRRSGRLVHLGSSRWERPVLTFPRGDSQGRFGIHS
jgi:hypothetical protein